jgi:3-oxoadipate enol-lactonase
VRVFKQFPWLEAGSVKMASSRPAHQRVTQAVGRIIEEENHLDSSEGTRTGFASINGISMYFETKGEGKPLLLLHAGVADSRMWDSQFEEFSTTHFVIRCDLRGFGQSGKSSGRFAHYEDIAALLKYLEVEPVSVIGSSFGGYVAIDFVLAYPERVIALVLAAPALGGYEFESAEMLEFFTAEEEALERSDLVAATELNLKMWVDGFNRQPETVSAEIRKRVREMQLNIFSQPEVANGVEKKLVPPAIDQLHQIMIPTLVIVGDQDVPEFQTISRLITQKVESARHVVISGTAHLPNMEKQEEFNQLIIDFLA